MFESLVERLLKQVIGEYIEGFNSENLSIGLWSGEVVIKNVALKKQIIKKINLPFKIKYSRLGCLKMIIPWKSLASSKIQVVVEGFQLLISEIPEQKWDCKNTKIAEKRKAEIKAYCESIVNDFAQKSQKTDKEIQEEGYFSKLVVKIIDNLQITIKDIHIRYQDQITNKYSFGLTLQQLEMHTVNAQGEPEFIDRSKKEYQNQPLRKNLILSNLGIYWNENSESFPPDNLHQSMLETIARRDQPKKHGFNHVILMSFNAKLYQLEAGKQFQRPQIQLELGFETLKVAISNEQLQQIVTFSERLQKYTFEVRRRNKKTLAPETKKKNREKFWKILPNFLSDSLTQEQQYELEGILSDMETSEFTDGIKKHMQSKQIQKMVKQKKQKSRGWFSGPKQLTQQQRQQIESFVHENIDAPIISVQRPSEFYYIQVNFVMNKLEFTIENSKSPTQKNGIRSIFSDIKIDFDLREGGYRFNFGIQNYKMELFETDPQTFEERVTTVMQKLSEEIQQFQAQQYISLKVIGNPLDKKHLDTEIFLETEELIFYFDPKIIQIAQNFANIKVSSENTDAALDAYGEIKNKTNNLASESLETYKRKSFMSIDARIKAMNVILFFNPQKSQGDIWALSLGNVNVFTDPDTLVTPQFKANEPMEKYMMKLMDVSMTHFESKQIFLKNKIKKQKSNKSSMLLNDFSADFEVEIYQQATDYIPKIKAMMVIHNLNLTISEFTYNNIQQIGNCFILPSTQSTIKEQEHEKIKEKSQVMKGSKKIGIIWLHERQTKKYIAVLNKRYIYLYQNKKDTEYSKYYYIKNVKTELIEKTLPEQKPFAVIFKNNVNQFEMGFDSEKSMHAWMDQIRQQNQKEQEQEDHTDEQKNKEESKPGKISPNTLNLEIVAKMERILIKTMLPDDKEIQIETEELSSCCLMRESKTSVALSLKSLQIRDNLYDYKYRELNKFLYSESIEGRNKLIDINLEQLTQKHPDYNFVDSYIDVNFGKLTCNYKCETIQRLMLFFIPPGQPLKTPQKTEQETSEVLSEKQQISKRKALVILAEILKQQPQRFSMKVNLNIQEISVSLINKKSKVMFGKLGMTGLKVDFGQSTRKMLLKGGLTQMWFINYTNYPYTITEEQSKYEKIDYILGSDKKDRDMMEFDIKILQTLNENGKDMLIYGKINDLKVSYLQQTVLRILTYLTQQMLPSLMLDGNQTDQPKTLPLNHQKPSKGTMQLKTVVQNIVIYIEPRTESEARDYLQVNIESINIENRSEYRPYVKNTKSKCVLVENYDIKMKGINLKEKRNEQQTKLTNDINFDISCDLIQNPEYYRKKQGAEFQSGMRVDCRMAPFLMKINHDNYNFMMKCLFWCIAYDDNAEPYLFDPIVQQTDEKGEVITDPIYFNLLLDKIAMCVTQNNLPITVLNLNSMKYNLIMKKEGMFMDLTLQNIFGTIIHPTSDPQFSKQLGFFNSFGYEKELVTSQLYQIDSLVELVSRDDMVYSSKGVPVIQLYIQMFTNGDMNIEMNIEALNISIELKNLLILSELAMMEDSIQPPKPIIESKKPVNQVAAQGGTMKISLHLKNFLASLNDKENKNFIVMEGETIVKMTMYPHKSDQQMLQLAPSYSNGYTLQIAHNVFEIRNFSLYFCNIKDMKNKRYIIKNFNVFLGMDQNFQKHNQEILNKMTANGNLQKIIIEASVKDLLKISSIIQDNLAKLPNNAQKQTSIDVTQTFEEKIIDTTLLNKVVKKKVIQQTKASIGLQPFMIQIINDCDNNFMPVISFAIQGSALLFESGPIKQNHLSLQNITLKMDFFNPRSSEWEPVLESFGVSMDYLSILNQYGLENKLIVTNSQIEQFSELKVNLSTQFVKSLKLTMDIAYNQQKKMNKFKEVDEFEVSPYIMQNLTYSDIIIYRAFQKQESTYCMPPLFKGPVRLTENAEKINFQFNKLRYSMNLDRFGINWIKGSQSLYIDFSIDKLNRVITFVQGSTIKNQTSYPIQFKRYDHNNHLLDKQPIKVIPQQMIPIHPKGSLQLKLQGDIFPKINMKTVMQNRAIISEDEKSKMQISEKKISPNHSIYSLKPGLTFINCLPKNVKIEILKTTTLGTKQIKHNENYQFFTSQNLSKLKFRIQIPGFIKSVPFGINPMMIGKEQTLYMNDTDNGTTFKYVIERKEKSNIFIFTIFTTGYIISQLDYDVEIFGNLLNDQQNKKTERYYALGGQDVPEKDDENKIVFIGGQTGSKIRVCGKDCLVDFSQPILIGGIGINQSRIVVKKSIQGKQMTLFTNIGVEINLRQMDNNPEIVSKQIIIRSRSIIVNESPYNIEIREEGCQNFTYKIGPKQKKPFYCSMPEIKERPTSLMFKVQNASHSIPIAPSQGSVVFKLEKYSNQKEYIYFKLIIEELQSYIFYVIHEIKEEQLPYEVIVKSINFEVNIPQYQRVLRKGSDPLYFVHDPYKGYHLYMQIRAIGGTKFQEINVDVDNLNYIKNFNYFEEGVTQMFLTGEIKIIFNDNKKFIVIDQKYSEEKEVPEFTTQTINMKINKIFVSMISNHHELNHRRPYQSFVLCLNNLQFMGQITNKRTIYQTRLQFWQMDQNQPFNLPNPVIITPHKFKEFIEETPKNKKQKVFLNSLIELDNSFVKNKLINQIAVDIEDLVVKIDTQFIKLILEVSKDFSELLNASKKPDFLNKKQVDLWKESQIPQQGAKTFIKALQLSPFIIDISASIRLKQLDAESSIFLGTMLNALGVVITDIDNAPILLEGIKITDCVDSLEGFNKKLMQHYRSCVLMQLYKVLGSLNIIGNPVSLFRNVATGFKDLKDKPAEGFVEGPLQFSKGLAQGATSLITHSVGGALNSVQKITGTVGSGLAALTFDKEFEEMREREKMKKPKHVFEGLQKGGKAVFTGFKQGITGVFKKPYQNTKKQGLIGFFKGTAQGVTGLIVKPVTGVVDFASNTTQGLKNTALYYQDKPNDQRIRFPRVFYTEMGEMREYNLIDCRLFAIVNMPKYKEKYGLQNAVFINSFLTNDKKVALLLFSHIIMVSFDDEEVDWAMGLDDCQLKQESNQVKICSKTKHFFQKSNQKIQFRNKQDQLEFTNLFRELQSQIQTQKKI